MFAHSALFDLPLLLHYRSLSGNYKSLSRYMFCDKKERTLKYGVVNNPYGKLVCEPTVPVSKDADALEVRSEISDRVR